MDFQNFREFVVNEIPNASEEQVSQMYEYHKFREIIKLLHPNKKSGMKVSKSL